MSPCWKLVSLPVLTVSLFGCSTEQLAGHDGRLDVVLSPANNELDGRRIEGSLALRTPEGRLVDRWAVEHPYDTLSVDLLEGSYLLGWQPVLAFDSEREAAAGAHAISPLGTPLSITAGRVTTVHARIVVAPDSLVARH